MIVVDSSVWIAHLRDTLNEAVSKLRSIQNLDQILVGDVILLEILQGARDERHAMSIEHYLRAFDIRPMLDESLAVRSAENYRRLRTKGITVRKTMDLIIATYCTTGSHVLLHDDRDFDLMKNELGLQTL